MHTAPIEEGDRYGTVDRQHLDKSDRALVRPERNASYFAPSGCRGTLVHDVGLDNDARIVGMRIKEPDSFDEEIRMPEIIVVVQHEVCAPRVSHSSIRSDAASMHWTGSDNPSPVDDEACPHDVIGRNLGSVIDYDDLVIVKRLCCDITKSPRKELRTILRAHDDGYRRHLFSIAADGASRPSERASELGVQDPDA